MSKEYKYLEVNVERTQFTTIYLKVPLDFNKKRIPREMLLKACEETLDESDWAWSNADAEINQGLITEVSESVAKEYDVFEFFEIN